MKKISSAYIQILWLIAISSLNYSCNKYVLFSQSSVTANESKTEEKTVSDSNAVYEKALDIDDKLMISIWDHDNLSVGSIHTVYSVMEESGKWLSIDTKGEVKLPMLGSVKLQGLTIREATLYLEKMYGKFIQNPIINIRLLNNEATVLGEVRKPGNYIFSSERIDVIDLLGAAEGFTDYAKTTHIKILSRDGEKIRERIIDLTDSSNMMGKAVSIKSGDIVYIPPSGGKGFDRFSNKLIPFASLLTAIAVLITLNN